MNSVEARQQTELHLGTFDDMGAGDPLQTLGDTHALHDHNYARQVWVAPSLLTKTVRIVWSRTGT